MPEVADLYARVRAQVDDAVRNLNAVQRELEETGREGQDAGREVDAGMRRATDGATTLKDGLRALATAGAIKAAAGFAEMALQEERAGKAFVSVSGGAQQAAANLQALEIATRGTMTQTQMLRQGAAILSLELANDAESLARVARNVDYLRDIFGGTMQQFQLMMSNQSLERVDAFGLAIEDVTERAEDYADAGRDATDAFQLAILDAMDYKFQQLGGSVDDGALALEQSRAAWQDFGATIGTVVAPTVTTLAQNFTELVTLTEQAAEEAGGLGGVLADAVVEAFDLFDIIPTAIDDVEMLNVAAAKGTLALEQGFSDAGVTARRLESNIGDVTEATEELSFSLEDLQLLMRDDLARAWETYTDRAGDAAGELADVQAQLDEYRILNGQVIESDIDRADVLQELAFAEEEVRLALERLNQTGAASPEIDLSGLRDNARDAESELRSIESQLERLGGPTFYGPNDKLKIYQDEMLRQQLEEQRRAAMDVAGEANAALAAGEGQAEAIRAREDEIRAQEEQLRLEQQLYRAQQNRADLLEALNAPPETYDYTEDIADLEERERELLEQHKALLEERVKAEQQAAFDILVARANADGVVSPEEVGRITDFAQRAGMIDPGTQALINQADAYLAGQAQLYRAPFVPSGQGAQMTPAGPGNTNIYFQIYGDLALDGANPDTILEQAQELAP